MSSDDDAEWEIVSVTMRSSTGEDLTAEADAVMARLVEPNGDTLSLPASFVPDLPESMTASAGRVFTEADMFDAFMSGFDESGEGYNGEYNQAGSWADLLKGLRPQFDRWLSERQ